MPVGADSTSGSQINNHAAFIWSVADLLRGDYKQSEYGRVILPLVVLRRLDCVLEPTKAEVLARHEPLRGPGRERRPGPRARSPASRVLQHLAARLCRSCSTTPTNVADNLRAYIAGFSTRGPGRHREVRLRRPDRPARQGQAALPGRVEVRRGRPPPRRGLATSRWATSTRS